MERIHVSKGLFRAKQAVAQDKEVKVVAKRHMLRGWEYEVLEDRTTTSGGYMELLSMLRHMKKPDAVIELLRDTANAVSDRRIWSAYLTKPELEIIAILKTEKKRYEDIVALGRSEFSVARALMSLEATPKLVESSPEDKGSTSREYSLTRDGINVYEMLKLEGEFQKIQKQVQERQLSWKGL